MSVLAVFMALYNKSYKVSYTYNVSLFLDPTKYNFHFFFRDLDQAIFCRKIGS